uniref:Uncharacterized protein n=1 Tax=viral metagenome TaxID=1070528 RepID=A0A6C0CW95_9ZZZZ
MSIFSQNDINNINNNKDKQVLLNRAIDEYKTYNYKSGNSQIDILNIPNSNIYDKYSILNVDNHNYNNSSKQIINDFYSLKEKLIHSDGMGINRFYNLLKNPQFNVIEKYNGDNISRIGMNTTQLYKDLCN